MSALPQPAPQTPRYQEKRETLLAAAAQHFNAQGIKGATLAEIAASVGLVTTSVTYYYRKKEDLATACLLRAIEIHAALAHRAAGETGVLARVASFFDLHAQLLADIERGRQPPMMAFADIRALPEAQAATVFTAYTDMFRLVRALLAGPETAGLGRDDLNARAHLMLSAANWVRSWIHHYEADEYLRVGQGVSQLLLHGLAAPDQGWPADTAMAALRLDGPPHAVGAGAASADTVDAFLRAATELVNEQGYRGASVDKISARLNVTKGSFYHHNETKDDLITACFERSHGVQRDTLRAAEQASGSGWLRACAVAASLVQLQLGEHGPLLRSTAISALPDNRHREQVRHTQQRLTERIANLLIVGIVDGSVRPLDPVLAAQLLSSAINAAAELQRWVPGITTDNASHRYTRPALLGLLCAA